MKGIQFELKRKGLVLAFTSEPNHGLKETCATFVGITSLEGGAACK